MSTSPYATPESGRDLDRLRQMLSEQYAAEIARSERDDWSKGFAFGLRHAIETAETLMTPTKTPSTPNDHERQP